MLIQLLLADLKNINHVNKKDPRGKIDSDFSSEFLVRGNIMQCIYLFTPQEVEKGRQFRIEQFSSQLYGQFSYGAPQKFFLFVAAFPLSSRMINLNPLPLCSSRSHKYSNYEKATCVVSSNLCLFTSGSSSFGPFTLDNIRTLVEALQKQSSLKLVA